MKYRVWDVENESYDDPYSSAYYAMTQDGGVDFYCHGDHMGSCDPEKYIIEPSTGVTDDNGEEIFVGDIVKARWYRAKNARLDTEGEVKLDNGWFYIKDDPDGQDREGVPLHNCYQLRVIGNIHKKGEEMKAKCKKCGDTVEVTRLREYKTCKCGAIGLDYGDGYYYRVCGNPEDFDGEIEGAPSNLGITKVEDPHKPEKLGVILNDYSTEELDNLMHDNHVDLSNEASADLTTALEHLETANKQKPSRTTSIAITKVEEAIMWLRKGE